MSKVIINRDLISYENRAKVIDVPIVAGEIDDDELASTKEKDPAEEAAEQIKKIRADWEEYKRKKTEELEEELESIKAEADNIAFDKVKEASETYENKLSQASKAAEDIVKKVEEESSLVIDEAKMKNRELFEQYQKKGLNKGSEEGYHEGIKEAERVVERVYSMMSVAIEKRKNIIFEANQQLLMFILATARRVVKAIIQGDPVNSSEKDSDPTAEHQHKRVVYDNITDILKSLRGRADIVLHVNSGDLAMVARHKREFMNMVEGIETLRIVEDNAVIDRGGVIVQTDFETIDATIGTQLATIEDLIRKEFSSPEFTGLSNIRTELDKSNIQ